MLLSLETTNFRKLVNSRFDFSSGLVAIRGANEQGKSTLLEALNYALFGSEALRESLDDVVTWGEKPSSLKVRLRLQIKDVYTFTRSKAGAEVHIEGRVSPLVTGQKEVTKFAASLLKVPDHKVASRLMIAKQKAITGALEQGATATAELIETLSNFQLIDELVQLAIEFLPSGSTKIIEDQIKVLDQRIETEQPVARDLKPLEEEREGLVQRVAIEQAGYQEANDLLPAAANAAGEARQRQQRLEEAKTQAKGHREQVTQAVASIAKLNLTSKLAPVPLAILEQALETAKLAQTAKTAMTELQSLVLPAQVWEGDRKSFDQEILDTVANLKSLRAKLAEAELKLGVAKAGVISETTCGFCGKDLSSVAEVVERNAVSHREIEAMKLMVGSLKSSIADASQTEVTLEGIKSVAWAWERMFNKHSKFVNVQDTRVPAEWEWTGPKIEEAQPVLQAQAKLQAMKDELQRIAVEQGKARTLEDLKGKAEKSLSAAEKIVQELGPVVAADRSISYEQDLRTKLNHHRSERSLLEEKINSIGTRIAAEISAFEDRKQAYVKLQEVRAKTIDQLEEMGMNNILIKKLRGARPIIADKLWSSVLSTVSHYCAKIRNEPSRVTRDPEGFKIEGKGVAGYAGSALDSLGLAIRIGLTKTFLPSVNFLITDEPASACDDNREANMLGVLTTCGFDQVLLVTHSELADTFAAQVIQL